jgi:hypothetical protein
MSPMTIRIQLPTTVGSSAAAMEQEWAALASDRRTEMTRHFLHIAAPDPWADAIAWLEQRQAAREEWSWPSR